MTDPQNSNRRGSDRFAAHLVVAVQPVDKCKMPLGPSIDAVALDISQGGVCFVSDHPLLASLAVVELLAAGSEEKITLLAERIRCRRVGAMFEIAVRFVEKLVSSV